MTIEKLHLDPKTEEFIRTLLYEGYAIFPYHRTAVKNQKPVPFGAVYPAAFTKLNPQMLDSIQAECIIEGRQDIELKICIRFLQMMKVEVVEDGITLPQYQDGEHIYYTGWQTVERSFDIEPIILRGSWQQFQLLPFFYDKQTCREPIGEMGYAGLIKTTESIHGVINVSIQPLPEHGGYKVSVHVKNHSELDEVEKISRDEAIMHTFLSTHTILKCTDGKFISHQQVLEQWQEVMAGCEQINQWPILMNESDTCMLASPIIVYDHPQLNENSPGDMFDGTEIEEALLIHLAVMSDEEKSRLAKNDEKMESMLKKISEVTPEEWIRYHGIMKANSQ